MTTTATWTWSGCSGWKGSWPKWGWHARRWARSSLWPKVALPQSSCFHKHRELKSLFSVLKVGHAPYKKFRTDKCSGKKTIHPKSVTFSLSSSVKSLSHVLTLCDPMDCGLPGSSLHGIFQARVLEWGHFLLQRIFPTQGSNPALRHCR